MIKLKFKFSKVPVQSLLGAAIFGSCLFGIISGNSIYSNQMHWLGASTGAFLFCLSCWIKKDSVL